MLDRASLEFCLADAFHPGCEMTWPMRTAALYMAPFRIAHAPAGWIEPYYGAVLGADADRLPNGPLLGGQLPGGITRWMAVPWQTDTASCRSGYLKSYDPYVPTFWPARVPNQVLTEDDYEIVMDQERPLADRLAAFASRASWLRPLGSNSYTDQINNMIAHFDHMGVVEPLRGPTTGRSRISRSRTCTRRRSGSPPRSIGTRPTSSTCPASTRCAGFRTVCGADGDVIAPVSPGRGPAGAVAALDLAPTRRVVLVERRAQPAPRIGESLPPAARRLMTDMGLMDDFSRKVTALLWQPRDLGRFRRRKPISYATPTAMAGISTALGSTPGCVASRWRAAPCC